MFRINKRLTDKLTSGLEKFQSVFKIAKKKDINEADTVSIIEDFITEVLGYQKYFEVTKELEIKGTYVDLAIKVEEKFEFLVEAKAVGIELKEQHVKQAVDYGANKGIQWVVLTNGIEWRLYRIGFEKPIVTDLVFTFDITKVNPKEEEDLDLLFALSKDGLRKKARELFFEKIESVNRFVIGQFLLKDPIIKTLRRELRKFAEGIKIEEDELSRIISQRVVKREILESEKAKEAEDKVKRHYRKLERQKKQSTKAAKTVKEPSSKAAATTESLTEKLLAESKAQKK